MASRLSKLMASAAIVMGSAGGAMAQVSTTEAGFEPGEIVVTAQKRTQSAQAIGVAVSALGADNLAALGRQDISALAAQVPGLQVNQYSPTVTVFNIRGVSQNDFADSQEAPIAFYNDEVYISALGAIAGMTYDLERVEVLRGPQGTLFGRNATGGLIQIVSAKPTDHLDGFVTATVGSYGQVATEGAVGGPLSDRLRARLSFTTNHGGGYFKNRIGRDLGAAKFYAGRIQLAGDVGEGGKFNIKVQALRNDRDRQAGIYSHRSAFPNALGLGVYFDPSENAWGNCNGCDALGYAEPDRDPFTGALNGPNYFSRTFWAVTARYEQDLGGATLTSITDYQDLRKRYGEDSDMSPATNFVYTTAQDLYQLSQELRLSGEGDRLTWLAGLYGIKIHTKNGYVTDTTGAFGLLERYDSVLNTESVAAFGQLEYKLDDRFTLIGGLRYSRDWKRFDYVHSENGVQDFAFDRRLFPDLAKRRFSDYSGKIELDFKPSRNAFLYASVNRGTKSGGFGTQAFGPFDPATIAFDGEVLTNVEGGVKLTLLNRTTNFNVAGFHYKYSGYQSFELVGVTQIIRNKPARIKGLEFEFTTRPVAGLYLQAFLTLLDGEVRNVTVPSGDVLDRDMPQAPSLSAGGLIRYEFAAGPGRLALQTNWKHDSRQYFSTFNAPVDREPARWVGDARVSYAFDDLPIEAAFFVNNLTDRKYRLYTLDLSGPFGFTQQNYARPRWFGGSLTYRIQ
ncbi:ligand-gated channel protein [Rhizorhabdus wittichii DC-6]|uniref:TonB-dependent receptor, plug n=1 Tax=Rhizorhabdus wittichii (strain DSM 6014 / CCUG 31198 / JCM 15750 / NBRC 105917 / EY 4224 / RW1) TaxID=392499 RepID=A0A9J9LGU8_RHIWR|nr:TonB-dependent receptor, plug [Rhizorhabdus wittichii RW1]ARR52324.1 ligand-gated channel protein [Rhizorhabdus wittichii DC-6]